MSFLVAIVNRIAGDCKPLATSVPTVESKAKV